MSEAFGARADMVVQLVDELRRTGAAVVELVAECEDGVVGHVLVSRGWVDAVAGLTTVGVLSPLSVRVERQRQGIGRALIEQVAAWVEDSGVPAIFLEGDPDYYAASGFVPAASAGFGSPSWRIPQPAFQVRLLRSYESWMTGSLVYPDAFWALGAVGP